ncbi:MAG: hypothetical protein Q7O66_03990 [Dehalococcoidia bacterium]|nr:hypothetical protein [Dehalococcoidia bacterium]
MPVVIIGAIVVAVGVALGYFGTQAFTWRLEKKIEDIKASIGGVAALGVAAVAIWLLWRRV